MRVRGRKGSGERGGEGESGHGREQEREGGRERESERALYLLTTLWSHIASL